MEDNMTPLSMNDRFTFSCSRDVPCFNECCKDLNQFLTPYDILRLKHQFGMSSSLFLERYTSQQTGRETGLPIITLKTDYSKGLACPFVTPSGCSVYKDRPSSCRTYPLMRIASRSRETGDITEQYILLKEPHCLGFKQKRSWTVREWIKDQDIAVYNEMNDLLMEIISLKNRRISGLMDMQSKHAFHMALYDIDTFRSHIFDNNILEEWDLDTKTLDVLKDDNVQLLKMGHKWIKRILLGHIEED